MTSGHGSPHEDDTPRFQLLTAGSIRVWHRAELEKPVRELGLLEPGGLDRHLRRANGPIGRAPSAVIPLAGDDRRLHLRDARRGGWLGPALGWRRLGSGRLRRELELCDRLIRRGVAVAEPVLVVEERRGAFVRCAVATIHQEACVDGIGFLAASPDREQLYGVARAAGSALRALHDAGVLHGDLHLGNLLVRDPREDPKVSFVDLDHAALAPEASPRVRASELMRLYRSVRKRRFEKPIDRRVVARFYAGYTRPDRALRRDLRGPLRRARRRLEIRESVRRSG